MRDVGFMQLVGQLAREEGGKSEARVHEIAQLVGIISEKIAANPKISPMLEANGRRRLRRKGK